MLTVRAGNYGADGGIIIAGLFFVNIADFIGTGPAVMLRYGEFKSNVSLKRKPPCKGNNGPSTTAYEDLCQAIHPATNSKSF